MTISFPSHSKEAFSAATLAGLMENPRYFLVLQEGARYLIGLFDQFPRVARMVSAQQKWFLTHCAFALHLERDPANPLTGITASRLLDIMIEFDVASRNTATAFLAEMLTYKFIRDVPGCANRRSRPLEPTETSMEAMRKWFCGQMRSLDLLDGGNRLASVGEDPTIFKRAQPIAARQLIADRAWRDPPASISSFVWTEYGGLILDDVISRIVNDEPENGVFRIDELRFSELSDHYGLSRTHIRRLFAQAERLRLIQWDERPGRRNALFVAAQFVEDYKRWQAVKFCALDNAYQIARQTRHIAASDKA